MTIPHTSTYCSNTTASNAQRIDAGPVSVWYSYRTAVAIQIDDGPIVVRKNEWGPTTGKHLNAIDGGDKSTRVDATQFAEWYLLASARLEVAP